MNGPIRTQSDSDVSTVSPVRVCVCGHTAACALVELWLPPSLLSTAGLSSHYDSQLLYKGKLDN